jgi:hypothetical protein
MHLNYISALTIVQGTLQRSPLDLWRSGSFFIALTTMQIAIKNYNVKHFNTESIGTPKSIISYQLKI